jgi:hypothetical protein
MLSAVGLVLMILNGVTSISEILEIQDNLFWIPAFAGVTEFAGCARASLDKMIVFRETVVSQPYDMLGLHVFAFVGTAIVWR